jgi:4-alpha-glucanotransferase
MVTKPSKSDRSAGILLHPTSLPGPYGVGDIGPAAMKWVDALVRARQKWWQILPLGPTAFGDSPYQCFSALAGNPYLISPDALVQEGLLNAADLGAVHFPSEEVHYGSVIAFKTNMLARAWENFRYGHAPHLRPVFEQFRTREARWLDDFALFMALKDAHGGEGWQEWPSDIRLRRPAAISVARRDLADVIGSHQFRQFLFFRQWRHLREYAHAQGVRLIGDIPIFVAGDSTDVWSNPQLFLLDQEGRPGVVAGVPPDYFSATGQLWGNPLYDWDKLQATGYTWWLERLRATLEQVDFVRLDHFRGFEAYWAIPAGMTTAEVGEWVKAPGADFLETVRRTLGKLPLIAEDLGIITPQVEELRDRFHLPGMRILQFAFGGAVEDRFLPHNYEHNTVVYTGTHDNDTTRGWYAGLTEGEAHFVRRYLGRDGSDIAWDLIRLAWASVANYALAPLQDVLDLGSEGRLNLPGRPSGNWCWRYTDDMLTDGTLDRLADLTELYGR